MKSLLPGPNSTNYSSCRAQRRSPTGWRTWWRCTQLESEMWRSWRAWTCTAEPAGVTPKSSHWRPTCTPTRVRSDPCCLRWHCVTTVFKPWWINVVHGGDALISTTLTYTSFSSGWKRRMFRSIRFMVLSLDICFHLLCSFHPSVGDIVITPLSTCCCATSRFETDLMRWISYFLARSQGTEQFQSESVKLHQTPCTHF